MKIIVWIMQLFSTFSVNLKYVSFNIIFITILFNRFIIVWFFSHSKLSTAHFWDILHRYKLFDSKRVGYIDFLYLLESFIYLSFVFTYRWLAWIIPPFVSIFLPFVAYQYWLIILILFRAFSIMLAMLILVLINNEQDQVHMF